jgi:hypothetical protein
VTQASHSVDPALRVLAARAGVVLSEAEFDEAAEGYRRSLERFEQLRASLSLVDEPAVTFRAAPAGPTTR